MLSDTAAPAEELQDKLAALEQLLLAYGRVAIGFSGGVDSSFWPRSAPASCLPIPSSSISPRRSSARPNRLRLSSPLMDRPMRGRILSSPCSIFRSISCSSRVACNDANRCYHCKHAGFTAIVNHAKSLGFPTVIDGSNASDRGDYRPGMRAAEELGVRSPLMEVGFTRTKSASCCAHGAIRLEPAGGSMSCHARSHGRGAYAREGRFNPRLRDYLHDLDLAQVRARLISGCMHIEAAPADVAKIAALGGAAIDDKGKTPLPAVIESALRELGCDHISPEVTPYIHGNMNL